MSALYQLLDPAKRAAALAQQQQDVSPETEAALQQIGVKKDADPGIMSEGPVTDTGSTAGPVATAPAAAPVSPRDEVEQRFLDKLRMGKQPGTPGSIVNTAPSWYQAGPPPARSTGADVLNTLVGAGAAGAQRQADLSAKEPLRPFAMKAADQGRANTASALGGLMNLLANRKQAAFSENQDAALKDAQMYRALNGSGSAGAQELGYLNYDQRRQEFEARKQAALEKAELAKRRADPNSEESHQAQAAMVAAGVVPEDQAKGMSATQLEKFRTALMQGNMIDSRNELVDRKFLMDRAAKGADKEAEQTMQIDKEKREEQNKKDASFIPGTYFVNGHPPPPADSTKARQLVGDRREMIEGAKRLKEIQERLNEAGTLAGAGGNYASFLLPGEEKKLVEEAKFLQSKMTTASRRMDNMGVPQQFEIELQNALNPKAGTLQGFFRGPAAWDAIQGYYDKNGAQRVRDLGYGLEGDGGQAGATQQDVPTEQQVRVMPKPIVHAYKRGGQGEEIPVPSPVDSRSAPAGGAAAAVPVGATGSTPVGIFTVKTAKGNSSPRPMTQAQYEKAVQAFGADNVTRMQ